MKTKKIIRSVIVVLVFLLSMYLINQCRKGALYVADTLGKGLDPEYDLGERYRMLKPFGYIIKLNEFKEIEPITDGGIITQFAFFNNWLIGKDAKGYFAVNKKTNEAFYPMKSMEELENAIGQSTQSVQWITDSILMEPYVIKSKGTNEVKIVTNIVSGVFALLVLFLFFLYMKKKTPKSGTGN